VCRSARNRAGSRIRQERSTRGEWVRARRCLSARSALHARASAEVSQAVRGADSERLRSPHRSSAKRPRIIRCPPEERCNGFARIPHIAPRFSADLHSTRQKAASIPACRVKKLRQSPEVARRNSASLLRSRRDSPPISTRRARKLRQSPLDAPGSCVNPRMSRKEAASMPACRARKLRDRSNGGVQFFRSGG